MKTAIIQYNAGNIRSVYFALKRLGIRAEITDDYDTIKRADKVIFPGVGEASTTMKHLESNGLDKLIIGLTQPVLAICLGMQLLCSSSEEGDAEGLSIIQGRVKRFDNSLKVPHMGWNQVRQLKSPLFKDVEEDSYVYFVHSYYVPQNRFSAATTDYGIPFSAALKSENSGEVGSQILKNFIEL